MSAILFALFIASLFLHARAAAVFKDRRVTLLDTKGVSVPGIIFDNSPKR